MLNEIDIIKNGRLFKRETCAFKENTFTPRVKLRIEWGWGSGNIHPWEGSLGIRNGKIVGYNPNFGPPAPNYIVNSDEKRCQWVSHTVGSLVENSGELKPEGKWRYARNGREGTNQIVFELEGNSETEIVLTMNGQKWQYKLEDLMENSHVELFQNKAVKVKIHRAVSQNCYQKEWRLIDDKPERKEDYYYVRISQENGQMAWSSPIWVRSIRNDKCLQSSL